MSGYEAAIYCQLSCCCRYSKINIKHNPDCLVRIANVDSVLVARIVAPLSPPGSQIQTPTVPGPDTDAPNSQATWRVVETISRCWPEHPPTLRIEVTPVDGAAHWWLKHTVYKLAGLPQPDVDGS